MKYKMSLPDGVVVWQASGADPVYERRCSNALDCRNRDPADDRVLERAGWGSSGAPKGKITDPA